MYSLSQVECSSPRSHKALHQVHGGQWRWSGGQAQSSRRGRTMPRPCGPTRPTTRSANTDPCQLATPPICTRQALHWARLTPSVWPVCTPWSLRQSREVSGPWQSATAHAATVGANPTPPWSTTLTMPSMCCLSYSVCTGEGHQVSASVECRPRVRPLGPPTDLAPHAAMLRPDPTLPIHRPPTPGLRGPVPYSWCMLRPRGVHLAWVAGSHAMMVGSPLHPPPLTPPVVPSMWSCGLAGPCSCITHRPSN